MCVRSKKYQHKQAASARKLEDDYSSKAPAVVVAKEIKDMYKEELNAVLYAAFGVSMKDIKKLKYKHESLAAVQTCKQQTPRQLEMYIAAAKEAAKSLPGGAVGAPADKGAVMPAGILARVGPAPAPEPVAPDFQLAPGAWDSTKSDALRELSVPLGKPTEIGSHTTNRQAAMMLLARVAAGTRGCTLHGGFLRDRVVLGMPATDVDVLVGARSNVDMVVKLLTNAAVKWGLSVYDVVDKGMARTAILRGDWDGLAVQVDFALDSTSKQQYPGVDCSAGNLRYDAHTKAVKLKVEHAHDYNTTVQLTAAKALVMYYDATDDETRYLRRFESYVERGWTVLHTPGNPVPAFAVDQLKKERQDRVKHCATVPERPVASAHARQGAKAGATSQGCNTSRKSKPGGTSGRTNAGSEVPFYISESESEHEQVPDGKGHDKPKKQKKRKLGTDCSGQGKSSSDRGSTTHGAVGAPRVIKCKGIKTKAQSKALCAHNATDRAGTLLAAYDYVVTFDARSRTLCPACKQMTFGEVDHEHWSTIPPQPGGPGYGKESTKRKFERESGHEMPTGLTQPTHTTSSHSASAQTRGKRKRTAHERPQLSWQAGLLAENNAILGMNKFLSMCKAEDPAVDVTIMPDMFAQAKGVDVRRADYYTLANGRCLNDVVIAAYFNLLVTTTGQRRKQAAATVTVLSTFAYGAVCDAWDSPAPGCKCKAKRRKKGNRCATCAARYAVEVEKYYKGSGTTTKILVPLNVTQNHWAYFSVDRRTATITYVDSLPDLAKHDPRYAMKPLRTGMLRLLKSAGVVPGSDHQWAFKDAHVRNQGATLDCGVHMCVHINVDYFTKPGTVPRYHGITSADAAFARLLIAHNIHFKTLTKL